MELKNTFKFMSQAIRGSKIESQKSDRSRLSVFFDMLSCKIKYGNSIQDYQLFGFVQNKDPVYRTSFIAAKQWKKMIRSLRVENPTYNLNDKVQIYKKYRDFYRRDVLLLKDASEEEVKAFLENHSSVFAKAGVSYGGFDVKKVGIDDLQEILKGGFDLLEEGIVQHPDMGRISPNAVSTVRFTVLKKEGRLHFLPTVMRIGLGKGYTDNLSQDGMCLRVEDDGVVRKHGYQEPHVGMDRTTKTLEVHPLTGVAFKGFKVPFYQESVEMIKAMMEMDDEYNHLGWDIAITAQGPVLVETNPIAGYDLYQYYGHMDEPKSGVKAEVEEFLGFSLD